MFQTFEVTAEPGQAGDRVAALRAAMEEAGIAAFLIPRTDRYRGETVAPCDERLSWISGFTGSAGIGIVAAERAALFVDGRYRLQVRSQTDAAIFDYRALPADALEDWLGEVLQSGEVVGFDPWLHTPEATDKLRDALASKGIGLRPVENLVDAVWQDRPAPPRAPATAHPVEFAGEAHGDKIARLASDLRDAGQSAAVLTVPESLAWLLNIRGADIANTPVVQAAGILHGDGRVQLFIAPDKVSPALRAHLGDAVDIQGEEDFLPALDELPGSVRLDKASVPVAVADALGSERIVWDRDPCTLPRAVKNPVELAGARRAQARDAVAMIRFLAWLDMEAPKGRLTEISAASALEGFRRATNALRDISFDTISGAGSNGAIVHYRVTEDTDARLRRGGLYLVDSGGQYSDGTTDITRTIAIGPPPSGAVDAFTAVLKGMIGMSRLRWPEGLAGRDIDAVARLALWQAGLDYDHGTGHGVGAYLGVHEGPQSLSRRSAEPLLPGMILSNEPGYYREGAFGIRIENLLVVNEPEVPDGGERAMLSYETLTYVPIDRRLIDPEALTGAERAWLDAYHAEVMARSMDALDAGEQEWLRQACAPL